MRSETLTAALYGCVFADMHMLIGSDQQKLRMLLSLLLQLGEFGHALLLVLHLRNDAPEQRAAHADRVRADRDERVVQSGVVFSE